MKILFYLLTHSPWLLNHLTALCNILPCSIFFFFFFFFTSALLHLISTSALLHLISTWFYSNPRGKFRFSEKARTSLKYPFFKTAVVKHFNHGQTVANQPKLFDFDTRRYKKYLTNFDGFDHNWSSMFISLANYSANVKKDADPSKLT